MLIGMSIFPSLTGMMFGTLIGSFVGTVAGTKNLAMARTPFSKFDSLTVEFKREEQQEGLPNASFIAT